MTFSKFDLGIFFLYENIKEIFFFHFYHSYFEAILLWKFGNLAGQFLDDVFVKICANFRPNPEKSNAQEIF